jgi:hypothetical protein
MNTHSIDLEAHSLVELVENGHPVDLEDRRLVEPGESVSLASLVRATFCSGALA